MNNTQKFAKIDKLADGLEGLTEHDIEEGNTPPHKKWKAAVNALPKEKKKEYFEQKYDESRKDKEWQKEQKLEKLYEKEIRPNTSLVHFWLGEKIVKEKKIAQEKNFIEESIFGDKDKKFQLESYKIQNIGVPETVDIDYSEIKDIPIPKHGVELKPYRDGFLIVRDENPKGYHSIDLSDYTDNPKAHMSMFFQTLVFSGGIHYYFRHQDIEKIKKHINNLSFYIVFKKAYKNKAFKITFKNNKYLTYIFKLALKNQKEKEKDVLNIVSNLPDTLITNFVEALGVSERYEMILDSEKSLTPFCL